MGRQVCTISEAESWILQYSTPSLQVAADGEPWPHANVEALPAELPVPLLVVTSLLLAELIVASLPQATRKSARARGRVCRARIFLECIFMGALKCTTCAVVAST